MKILIFGGALRKESFNQKLAAEAARFAKENPANSVSLVKLADFDIPLYNGDIEEESGVPAGVLKFSTAFDNADAVIISCPEYNAGMSGVLKNAVDWLSRNEKDVLKGKHLLLLGASPGGFGAIRSLTHSRVPFIQLGMHVYSESFGLAKAHEAFDESGKLKDSKSAERVKSLVNSFLNFASRK